MKDPVELMLTMTDMTGTVFPNEVIGAIIEKQAEARLVARNLCRTDRSLMNSPGITLVLPKRVDVSATTVSEGASLTLQTPSYDSVSVTVSIYGAAVEMGEESLDVTKFNLVQDQLENLGIAMATKIDYDIIKELIDWTDSATEAVTATGSITVLTLAQSHVIEVTEIVQTGTTITPTITVDYEDGLIHFSGAPSNVTVTYAYNASVPTVEVATAGVLGLDAIIKARNKVTAAMYKPDSLIIHPDQETDILQDSNFTDASKYGNSNPIQNGEIGKIAGLTVYVTTQCPKGIGIVFDSAKAMMFVVKREMYTKLIKEGNFAQKGTVVIATKMWAGPLRVNDGAICMINGAQDDSEIM